MSGLVHVVPWVPAEGVGAEHLSLQGTAKGVVGESVAVGARGGAPHGLRYRVVCDALWRVREAVLSLAGEDRRLHLRADGEGNWQDSGGHPARRQGPDHAISVWGTAEGRMADGGWLLGRYSVADIHLFRLFWRFNASLRPDLAAFPKLAAHHDRMLTRPAVQRTIEAEAAIGYELPG